MKLLPILIVLVLAGVAAAMAWPQPMWPGGKNLWYDAPALAPQIDQSLVLAQELSPTPEPTAPHKWLHEANYWYIEPPAYVDYAPLDNPFFGTPQPNRKFVGGRTAYWPYPPSA